MCKENKQEDTQSDYAIAQNNLVNIPIIIDGKTYSIEQAREIWEKLDEIFGEIVVRQPYPVYPSYPVEPIPCTPHTPWYNPIVTWCGSNYSDRTNI
jgi:hypothetical protein